MYACPCRGCKNTRTVDFDGLLVPTRYRNVPLLWLYIANVDTLMCVCICIYICIYMYVYVLDMDKKPWNDGTV
jgi:hypothetical protein